MNSNTLSEKNKKTIVQHQKDMRYGYGNGALGVFVSGTMWLLAAFVAFQFSDKNAIYTLFIGGMFIFPISMLLAKITGIPGTHSKGNPLGTLAMESTVLMIICISLALLLSLQQNSWFFNATLLIIGGRYLTFHSIYGLKIYYILGALLVIAGYLLFFLKVSSFVSALVGGIIEILFGVYMWILYRQKISNN